MKHRYKIIKFKPATLEIIERADELLTDYAADGYSFTLRQLYYQFVKNGWLPNTQRSYKRFGSIINDARLAGLLDWAHMVDRTRRLESYETWVSTEDILSDCARWYTLDRWLMQKYRVEVWVEKEALIDVVGQACAKFQVPHFACKGYTSQSAQHKAAQRLIAWENDGYKTVIIHLGDHDPSGIDMTRDTYDRLTMFGSSVDVQRIALNIKQVERLALDPNPAKLTDSRAGGYVAQFGLDSWELDALDPKFLDKLIKRKINSYINREEWDDALEREQKGREYLEELAEREDQE